MVGRTDIGLEQVDLELKRTLESHEDIFLEDWQKSLSK